MITARFVMTNKGQIYLSGAMEHASDGTLGAGWRAKLSQALTKMGYQPLDITAMDVAYQAEYGDLFNVDKLYYGEELQRKSNIRKHFISADLKLLENDTDAMVILYDEGVQKGAGSLSECQHAYNLGIPIFLVNGLGEGMDGLPGWLVALTTKIFDNFDWLLLYLDDLPTGILTKDVYGNRSTGHQYLCSLCGSPFTKNKHHYVSTISPLYCGGCVEMVAETNEAHPDRYEFFVKNCLITKEED